MTIRVMEEARQLTLAQHVRAAGKLEAAELERIVRLASQLRGKNLLPVVGAGASYDCGVRVASEIGEDLLAAYLANPTYAQHDTSLDREALADIAEAIWAKSDQSTVVRELGIPDPDLWLPSPALAGHFCVYCVLARMVREGHLAEAFGFNYDCGAEAGLSAEGFAYGEIAAGERWRDRAWVVADNATNSSTTKDPRSFTLFKANGCAVRYRELAEIDEKAAADGIVIRRAQLDDWKSSGWSLDNFRARARDHVMMLIWFSAQDSKFSSELRDVLSDVYDGSPPDGHPRVIAVDLAPESTPIEGLIKAGLGEAGAADGVVTKICTGDSTATAAMLVLLAEMLAIELEEPLREQGARLPTELDARLATLAIVTPTMLRWAYLARAPGDRELIQRANQIAAGGYVPLSDDPELSARLIAARANLRQRLGRADHESSEETLDEHGFVADAAAGFAFMPVGIEQAELAATCRPGEGNLPSRGGVGEDEKGTGRQPSPQPRVRARVGRRHRAARSEPEDRQGGRPCLMPRPRSCNGSKRRAFGLERAARCPSRSNCRSSPASPGRRARRSSRSLPRLAAPWRWRHGGSCSSPDRASGTSSPATKPPPSAPP